MVSLFLHGSFLPGGEDHPWVADLRGQLAVVRARRWRLGRGARILVPGTDDARVRGLVVDMDLSRQRVIELLERAVLPLAVGAVGLARPSWIPVLADSGLRPRPVVVWGFPSERLAAIAGARPTRGGDRRSWAIGSRTVG